MHNLYKGLCKALAVCAALGFSSGAMAYSISGLVFCDANRNGVMDLDETPLAGVTVSGSDGVTTVTAVTGPDGAYSISNLNAGDWTVGITDGLGSGASIVAPAGGSHVVTLDPYPTPDGIYFVDSANFAVDDPSCRASYCGDGVLDLGEACDDGNNIDGDGCSALCTVESYCGDGFLDPGEQCDDGNLLNGDGCSAMCTFEGGGEGCTPGYWRQRQHFDAYPAPYTADTPFGDVFVDAFPGQTLAEVAAAKGGGLNALGRHAVAALLNAASADVSYDRTAQSVIDSFNYAYGAQEFEFLKNRLEAFNEQGCPLN